MNNLKDISKPMLIAMLGMMTKSENKPNVH